VDRQISLSLKTDEAAVNCDVLREVARREIGRNLESNAC
jgi:hypothetical protein